MSSVGRAGSAAECGVCLERFNREDKKAVVLGCGCTATCHECALEILNQTNVEQRRCPICQVAINREQITVNHALLNLMEETEPQARKLRRYERLEQINDPGRRDLLSGVWNARSGSRENAQRLLDRVLQSPHSTAADKVSARLELDTLREGRAAPASERLAHYQALAVKQWRDLGVDPVGAPRFPANIEERLAQDCPYTHEPIRDAQFLFWIPAQIRIRAENGEPKTVPLTLDLFCQLVIRTGRNPFSHAFRGFLPVFGNIELEETCGLITKRPIPESGDLSLEDQEARIEVGPGYEIPKVANLIIGSWLHHLSTEGREYPLGGEPLVHSRCQETLGKSHLIVGGFKERGISVHFDGGFNFPQLCACAMRVFS